jgi:hypothetical protein
MLARIQTLYLVLVALLAFGSMALPYWSFNAGQLILITDFYTFQGAETLYRISTFSSGLCSPLTGLLSLGAILLFKNRSLQRILILLALLFFLGDLFSELATAHLMNQHLAALGFRVMHQPQAGLFMLLPEPVLLILALKGIKKDEKIATAYKRL